MNARNNLDVLSWKCQNSQFNPLLIYSYDIISFIQDCSSPSALAMKLLQSRIKLSICAINGHLSGPQVFYRQTLWCRLLSIHPKVSQWLKVWIIKLFSSAPVSPSLYNLYLHCNRNEKLVHITFDSQTNCMCSVVNIDMAESRYTRGTLGRRHRSVKTSYSHMPCAGNAESVHKMTSSHESMQSM